jgi:serine O-acetyltransferase
MSVQGTRSLRRRLTKLWLFSPEKLWLTSIALQRHGHWMLAFAVKQLNTILYHNSLAPEASVSPDIALGHYSHGVVVARNVEIGRRVKIWHNVTLTAGRPARRGGTTPPGPLSRIIVEDGVKIGTNAVIIAPRGRSLRIGRGARIGAGATVTEDVPSGATVVSQPVRVLLRDADGARDADAQATAAEIGFPEHSADPPRGDPPGRDGA